MELAGWVEDEEADGCCEVTDGVVVADVAGEDALHAAEPTGVLDGLERCIWCNFDCLTEVAVVLDVETGPGLLIAKKLDDFIVLLLLSLLGELIQQVVGDSLDSHGIGTSELLLGKDAIGVPVIAVADVWLGVNVLLLSTKLLVPLAETVKCVGFRIAVNKVKDKVRDQLGQESRGIEQTHLIEDGREWHLVLGWDQVQMRRVVVRPWWLVSVDVPLLLERDRARNGGLETGDVKVRSETCND